MRWSPNLTVLGSPRIFRLERQETWGKQKKKNFYQWIDTQWHSAQPSTESLPSAADGCKHRDLQLKNTQREELALKEKPLSNPSPQSSGKPKEEEVERK